jgi:hypothetical protein
MTGLRPRMKEVLGLRCLSRQKMELLQLHIPVYRTGMGRAAASSALGMGSVVRDEGVVWLTIVRLVFFFFPKYDVFSDL